jgi:hypothetical protein
VLGTLALVYVAVKRVNPAVTVDDIRNLGQDDLEIAGVEEAPPLTGAGTETAPPSTETSPTDSEEDPEETPPPTGTES